MSFSQQQQPQELDPQQQQQQYQQFLEYQQQLQTMQAHHPMTQVQVGNNLFNCLYQSDQISVLFLMFLAELFMISQLPILAL